MDPRMTSWGMVILVAGKVSGPNVWGMTLVLRGVSGTDAECVGLRECSGCRGKMTPMIRIAGWCPRWFSG